MMSRQRKVALLVLVGLIALLCLTDSAFAAKIKGISAGKADKAVTEGIGTFWDYALFIIPIIGVVAIIFGLWNAITTDRGQSSSVVSGLTTVGVGFVMVFIPVMVISGYATSGSEAASLREWGPSLTVASPIDWGSPITLFIILGYLRWRLTQTAKRRRHERGDVAYVSH
jgi:MFS superfamily sulfate permease-like transporter